VAEPQSQDTLEEVGRGLGFSVRVPTHPILSSFTTGRLPLLVGSVSRRDRMRRRSPACDPLWSPIRDDASYEVDGYDATT
jgi:hypothetical protein